MKAGRPSRGLKAPHLRRSPTLALRAKPEDQSHISVLWAITKERGEQALPATLETESGRWTFHLEPAGTLPSGMVLTRRIRRQGSTTKTSPFTTPASREISKEQGEQVSPVIQVVENGRSLYPTARNGPM